MLLISEDGGGVTLRVRVQPRAARNMIQGVAEDALKVRLTAPPVDGEANAACCAFIAEIFGVAPSRVVIAAGHKARLKQVRIAGITRQMALERLQQIRE